MALLDIYGYREKYEALRKEGKEDLAAHELRKAEEKEFERSKTVMKPEAVGSFIDRSLTALEELRDRINGFMKDDRLLEVHRGDRGVILSVRGIESRNYQWIDEGEARQILVNILRIHRVQCERAKEAYAAVS